MDTKSCVSQTSDGIQPGCEAVGQMIRFQRRFGRRDTEQSLQAGAGRALQTLYSFPNNNPVLIQKGNDICYGRDSGEV